jgi:hypothetical protein
MALKPTTKVWRYMSFAKFVWMLKKKHLWLPNVRYLEDKWELTPDTSQINYIIDGMKKYANEHSDESMLKENFLMRIAGLVDVYRDETFVSCWNASEHESHALWKIYCPTSEGVAIQTSLDRLKRSVDPWPVFEVSYAPYKEDNGNPLLMLIVRKRPMYAYEQEVRVVLSQDAPQSENLSRIPKGTEIPWSPEDHIENIWIHPDAQPFFAECVTEIVKLFAPKLEHQVWWSKMNTAPPF